MTAATDLIGFACVAVAALGCLYVLAAAALLPKFDRAGNASFAEQPGVSILKPLRGAEPALPENLRSFCTQHYAAPIQVICGVEHADDPAVAVVRALANEFPALDITLVVTGASSEANPKIATLCAIERCIRHDVVVLADSDIRVPGDYLARVADSLQSPNVGVVTCLYRGDAQDGLWSQLARMAIDHHFLPSVIVGMRSGIAQPCFGSTIALRRQTLSAIGGFAAFADHLADDYAIGEAVRATGQRVEIPAFVVTHTCSEPTFTDLVRHELRWARTIRAVDPIGYAGSIVTHPLPFAFATWTVLGSAIGLPLVAAAIACRLALAFSVDRALGVPSKRCWLGPVRDLLSFAIFVAAFFVRTVTWRGRRYRVRSDATVTVQVP